MPAEPTWKHSEVFPIIERLIAQEHQRHGRYVTAQEITNRLINDPEAQTIIAVAREQQQGWSLEHTASNMVAWFSQRITVGDSEYIHAFERTRVNGQWAYRPTTSVTTYLLKWSPKIDPWSELDDDIRELRRKGFLDKRWSCGVTKRIKRGDRVFLLRNTIAPTGIVASGFVTQEPHQDTHYARGDEKALYVGVRFDTLLNAEQESIVRMEDLDSPELADGPWHVQGSGKTVPARTAAALEIRWASLLAAQGRSPVFLADEVPTPSLYFEGATRRISINSYERSPDARRDCIQHYGCRCAVCGFSFDEKYGELGQGFIHVHHLKQLSEIGEEYQIDPVTDLRPVCPNCHAMIHRGAQMMTIEELRARIR